MPQAAQTPPAGRRPDPCRARWRHSSPRPPPPHKGRRSPSDGLQAVPVLHGQLSDPLHGAIQFRAATGSPLRCLSEASIPPIAFSRHCSSAEDLYAQLARQKLHRLVTHKAVRTTSRLRATVHRWPSPSGPAGKAWPGENVDEPSSPAFTTGPSTATFFSKLSVMFRSSLRILRLSQFCVQGNRVRLSVWSL